MSNVFALHPATSEERWHQVEKLASEQPWTKVRVLPFHGIPETSFKITPEFLASDQAWFEDFFGPGGYVTQIVITDPDDLSLVILSGQAGKLDTLQISVPGVQNGDTERIARITRSIARARTIFKAYAPNSPSSVLGDELAEFYTVREGALGKLESTLSFMAESSARLLREIGQGALEQEREREQRHTEYRSRLEEEYRRQRVAIEEEAQTRISEANARVAAERTEIDALLSSLKQREDDLDNRTNTHARRQLRQDVKRSISTRNENFSLSKSTIAKRWPIRLLCALLMSTSLVGIVGVLLRWFGTDDLALSLSRQIFFVTTFTATAIFYMRWENLWFQTHANEELRLKRLDLDIDRASWVVETTLEYKHEGKDIPPALLQDLSRNLFSESSTAPAKHPSESLGEALLGASNALRMRMGETELELNRNGMRAFKTAAKRKEREQ